MRISDWSSDVCSSDLLPLRRSGYRDRRHADPEGHLYQYRPRLGESRSAQIREPGRVRYLPLPQHAPHRVRERAASMHRAASRSRRNDTRPERDPRQAAERSEEHTSELQSLMRISYAVFCLKKKTQTKPAPKIQL